MTTILLCVGSFWVGCFCGAVLASILAAAGQADDHITSMCLPASDIADQLSDRMVRDFHVVTDDEGRDHIVPTEASPPTAAERGSPPAG